MARLKLQPQITDPTSRFQASVAEMLRTLEQGAPWLDGVLVELPPQSAAATISLQHGLGRVPRGMAVLDVARPTGSTVAVTVYRIGTPTVDALSVRITASITAGSVWVW